MPCNNSNSIAIPEGNDGLPGSNGNHGGVNGRWSFSTSTVISPSAGQIRFNNTASSLVTTIYVSDTGLNSIDHDLLLDSFSNSGSYGVITIFKEFDSTKFWIGEITNVVDSGTYHTLTVTYIEASNATIPTNIFAASDNLVLTFAQSGLDGTNGTNGVEVLNNVTTGSATTSGTTLTTLLSYTVTAGKCLNDQDGILITSWVEKSNIADEFTLTLVINSVIFGTYTLPNGVKCGRLRATITRESATTYFFESILTGFDATSGGFFAWGASANTYASGALTFANTIPIDIKMQRVSGSGTATSKQLNVIFLNK